MLNSLYPYYKAEIGRIRDYYLKNSLFLFIAPNLLCAIIYLLAGKLDLDIARKNVKTIRVQKGLKREAFARSLGMSYKTLANFEGGNNTISDEFLSRISSGLGVSVDDICSPDFDQKYRAGLATSKTEPAKTRGAGVLRETSGAIEEFLSITEGASDETIDDILAYARWRVGRAGARKASAGEVSYTMPKRG